MQRNDYCKTARSKFKASKIRGIKISKFIFLVSITLVFFVRGSDPWQEVWFPNLAYDAKKGTVTIECRAAGSRFMSVWKIEKNLQTGEVELGDSYMGLLSDTASDMSPSKYSISEENKEKGIQKIDEFIEEKN